MRRRSRTATPGRYFLKAGYIYLARDETSISAVVGSGVAVCLYDRKRRAGGMNHFRQPHAGRQDPPTAVFGNAATLGLIRMMTEAGSRRRHLEAQIIGGAYLRDISPRDIGRENIAVARRILFGKNIRIVSEDTGGSRGRKVVFNTRSGETAVMKVERLRRSDWFPYEDER